MTIYIGPENFDLHIELFWGPGDSYFVMLHWMPRMKQMIKHEFQRKLSEMAFQAGQDLVTSCFFLDVLLKTKAQWIGLRENLQETMDFPIEYGPFL
jgi:hypothetical protein